MIVDLCFSGFPVRPRPERLHRGAPTVGFEGLDESTEENHPDGGGARGSL